MVHFFFFNDPATTEIYTYLHPLSLHDALPIYGLTTGRVSAPANTGRGEILGVEATLDLPFRALTSALDGFGVFATGNYTYSSIKFANNPIEAITSPGLSKWTGSGTVYFEQWGFEARGNSRYRLSFIAGVHREERRVGQQCVR